GKTYYDLRLALEILGLDEEGLKAAGIRTYKLGVISPVEPEGLREFAEGLDEILVVEEKRPFLEMQICHELYNAPSRPSIYGKTGPRGEPLFQKNNELQPEIIAARLAGYLGERLERKDLQERVQRLDNIAGRSYRITASRIPYYCSGCPHNTSTKIPEGAVAGGGIGCHGLAFFMERGVGWFAHMGGEGAPWIGLNHYVDKDHIFQNVGDGTFFHSGSKALEACIAAKVNVTFKILCNGTVAMTGGQEVVAGMEPLAIARRLELEGVAEIVIVPEETAKYPSRRVSGKITVRPKDDYNQVMLDLRKVEGVTAIIFDQQCATEKRRLRTQGKMETPDRRVFSHEGICEGCGDCGVKSNCLSVIPVETEYGRKTAIHQSSCNFEFSCLQGDCPALMTVHLDPGAAAAPRAGLSAAVQQPPPEPAQKAQLGEPYKIMMAGVGGSGVVTTDALLMEAAFSEGLHVVHLDQTGLSQKAGSVMSNIIIAKTKLTRPAKISAGEADLLLAFDLLSSVAADNLHRLHPDCSTAIVNTHRSHTGETIRDVKAEHPPEEGMLAELERFSNKESMIVVDAEQITTALFGNARSNNIFMLGVAYQAGLLPLKAESVEAAIAVNGVAVEQNVQAFRWGRRYRQDPDAVKNLTGSEAEPPDPIQEALEQLQDLAPGRVEPFRRMAQPLSGNRRLTEIMAPRLADLILSRNAAYARNYLDFVGKVVDEEARRTPGRTELGEAVARWLFKLMAYKD
ncbi:MAG: 2-oxoacid:acceptor oxidoreductase family protein, partial [bacterium]